MLQLALPDADVTVAPAPRAAPLSADALARRLAAVLGAPLSLVLTNNRRRVFSLRYRDGVRALRVHELFLTADDPVIDALGRWLSTRDRDALRRVDDFVRARRVATAPATSPADPELAALAESLRARHFPTMAPARVAWSRPGAPRRRARSRAMRLGAWLPHEDLIVLHPALAERWVPSFYLGWVLFHELSHRALGEAGGRGCRVHGPAFRALEATYPEREMALAWERQHLQRLIDERGSGQR